MQLLSIFLAGLLTNNIIFKQSWGLCPFLGVSKKTNSAIGMGLSVTLVMIIITPIVFGLAQMTSALNITYMNIMLFILVIASTVQFLEIVLKRFAKNLYNSLGLYLPLITTNCAIMLIANLTATEASFLNAITNSVGTGLGFLLALVLMAGVREKLEKCDIPAPLKGFPIALCATAIIALAFYGFNGIF